MRILDFYPSQGSFSPGEAITLLIEIEASTSQVVTLRILIQHLADSPTIIEQLLPLAFGEQTVQIRWTPPGKPAGYSVQLEIPVNDSPALYATTAFDVLSSWTDFPRYGFLTDFSVSRADPKTVLKKLTRFHINGLQFYDWQYRHDQLMAPTEEYSDPLGREMSLAAVRKLVAVAHQHGMAAMPYLAIYAASAGFWRAHPDWALYDAAGNPIAFGENFLGLMDPTAGNPWSEHLLAESAHALQDIAFDGLHIDQYGDPKQAWDSQHNSVNLPQAFVDFIQSLSDQHPHKTILFNAVGNWPIEALAESAADFIYIEVWPPDLEYRHLAEIVLNAVHLSHGKAVVIALYLPADHFANNLLGDAVILACGGTRIELGEEAHLLSDPYFPKHEEISPVLYSALRQLSDFTVRNGEWLRPYSLLMSEKEIWAGGELNPEFISTDDSIMTVARRYPKSLMVQLVNFNGLDSHLRWNEAHPFPTPCWKVSIRIQMSQRPSQIFWDCPEKNDRPQALDFEYANGKLTFQVPQINFIGLISIHD
ncbi:MAG TPA: glycoside hydrolase family 66 protein [Anaerolineales bacterium]|nr:glycoside hydrolase family 66 protein [Anaerolineales bacterium]